MHYVSWNLVNGYISAWHTAVEKACNIECQSVIWNSAVAYDHRERERVKSKVLPEPYGPYGSTDLRSIGPQPDTSLHCKIAVTGPMHCAVCPLTPRRLGRYQIIQLGRWQIILLGDRGTWVWTTCSEFYLIAAQPGIELTTSRSWIWCSNHYATKPPLWP